MSPAMTVVLGSVLVAAGLTARHVYLYRTLELHRYQSRRRSAAFLLMPAVAVGFFAPAWWFLCAYFG